jgi:hypothetical protein
MANTFKVQRGYDISQVPSRFFNVALKAVSCAPALAEKDGHAAIVQSNSKDELVLAIWEAGSSQDGEADLYFNI